MAKKNNPSPRDVSPLKTALAALDAYLKESDADMHKAMAAGASEKELALLSREVFANAPVPEELSAWFGWHNGQRGTDQELSPDRTFHLIDIAESVAAWKSLRDLKKSEDLQEPWELTWLPLMTNGGGDYLVFEFAKAGYGHVLEYWHADEDRDVVAKSLAAFAKSVIASRKQAAKGPKRLSVDWNLAAAKPLDKSLTNADVFNAPVGTTYFGGPAGEAGFLVCVRAAPDDCWVAKWNKDSLEAAFAEAGAIVQANDSMKFYGVPGAFAHVSALLKNPKSAATAKFTVAKIT